MAELLTGSNVLPPRLVFNNILIECMPDGVVVVTVPPEFVVSTVSGVQKNNTGRLYTQAIIAPRLEAERAARPTETGLKETR